jgi:hypothetical protein
MATMLTKKVRPNRMHPRNADDLFLLYYLSYIYIYYLF